MKFTSTKLPLLLLSICLTFLAINLLSAKSPPQRCTAIAVPTSTNFPVIIAGKRTVAPQQFSAAFKPILSLVELPPGFKAVGGGAGLVIACTE